MCDVKQAVVVVLIHAEVAAQVEVIEPDIGGLLNSDAVAVNNLAELEVADNDVLDPLDGKVDAGKRCDYGMSATVPRQSIATRLGFLGCRTSTSLAENASVGTNPN